MAESPLSLSPGEGEGEGRAERGVKTGGWEVAARGAREARSEPEPVVRVTIGRVEVRAVTAAPPAPPAARPAGPRLSLEDYLRRRNEGRM